MTTAVAARLAEGDRTVMARFRPSTYDPGRRTVVVDASTTTPVQRWGGLEVLDQNADAWDLSRLDGVGIPVLDSHRSGSLDAVLGRVVSIKFEKGRMVATLAFADTEEGRRAEGMVARGEIGGVSIGYRPIAAELAGQDSEGRQIIRITNAELLEVSFGSVVADPNAVIRSHPSLRGQTMDPDTITPPATAPDLTAAQTRAEERREAAILRLANRANIPHDVTSRAVVGGTTVEQFRNQVFDVLAERSEALGARSSISVTRDEGDTRVRAMTAAFAGRLGVKLPDTGPHNQYRDDPSYVLAAKTIGYRGDLWAMSDRDEVLQRAMHTTSDFPVIVEGALRASIGARYALAQVTHRVISVERIVQDFRPVSVARPGDFAALQQVGQGGEIRFGTFGEAAKETYAVGSYGVQFNVSRQLLINDNLGAIEQILAGYGDTVALFEERIFYAATLNVASGAGPTMGDGQTLFHASHGNLAGSGAVINTASVSAGRTALRRQTGIPSTPTAGDGLQLNVESKFLVCSPEKETEADTILAAITPNQVSQVNPFAGTMTKVVVPQLTGNAWYLAADPERTPTLVRVKLAGYEAPRLRLENSFGVQGLGVSLEHDFGAGAIDWRGFYRNPGA